MLGGARKKTSLLVINTIFRLLHPYEYLKQDSPLSLRNITGEFQLAERKTCLGWEIHTRSLWVFLLRIKYTDWLQEIRASL